MYKIYVSHLLFIIILSFYSHVSLSENVWVSGQKIAAVHTLSNGNFVLQTQGAVSSVCQGSGTLLHVYNGQNAVTAEGLQALFATAIIAETSGATVGLRFNRDLLSGSAKSACYLREIKLDS